MFHYFGTVTNTKGDSLTGWQVEVVDYTDGSTVIPIYADENSTAISTVSGVSNRALSDAEGNYDFFVDDGTYSLRFYDDEGVFQKTQRYVSMYGSVNNLSASTGAGQVGTSSGGTVQSALSITRAALKALTPANNQRAMLSDGQASGLFVFSAANLSSSVTADPGEGVYIAPDSDATGASGAWVRTQTYMATGVYLLEWWKPALDASTNDLTAIQRAINLLPAGGTLIFPGGKTAAISGGSVDFRNKGDCRFRSAGGRFTFRQATANTVIAYYGANSGSTPQSGELRGFNFLHATQQTNAQTSGNGLIFYWCANAIFDDLYAQNCYRAYSQATDTGTASVNVVFDCSFNNIYAYGFTGYGFHLAPIGTAGTPNRIDRMYLNGGGQTAVRALSLVGQDEYISKINLEFVKCSEAVLWNSGSGSSVRIDKLYMEKATVTSAHRGMVYVGVNSLSVGQWQINATTFDSADASTVYLCAFFDGVIDVQSFGITGTTLTGPPTLQFFRAFNSTANPAKQVRIGTVSNPSGVAITLGDTRDTLMTRFEYPFPEQQTLAASGAINPDFRSGWTAVSTLTGNLTLNLPVVQGRRKGRRATLILTQDATGGRTVTFDSDYVVTTAVDTAANAVTIWDLQWDGAKWREV